MKMPPNNMIENKRSRLLNQEDNAQLFRLLGHRCQSIATAVVQLYVTEPPNHAHWIKRHTGILCLVKDSVRKSYFFRVFCFQRNAMVWEHEIYNNMEYNDSTSFLHIFEGQEGIVAFNFTDNEEARDMKNNVDMKLAARRKREERRKNSRSSSFNDATQNRSASLRDMPVKKTPDPVAKAARRKRALTKADIGAPKDFKHVSHVGFNPNSGFELNAQDPHLIAFFAKAGVSERQLQDYDTREFIYNFINTHGGREAVIDGSSDNASNNSDTSIVDGNLKVPSSLFPSSPVPPVPPRGPHKAHVRAAPPPPPSGANRRVSPKSVQQTAVQDCVPPPPPPLPSLSSDESITSSVATPPGDVNTALLASIRQGTTLKPVEERRLPEGKGEVVVDTRNDLLSEIRKGFSLKPVQDRELKPVSNNSSMRSSVDLAGALAQALAERNKAIHSDEEDEEDDSNEEDWD